MGNMTVTIQIQIINHFLLAILTDKRKHENDKTLRLQLLLRAFDHLINVGHEFVVNQNFTS